MGEKPESFPDEFRKAVFRYHRTMEVHLTGETEKKLKDLSALAERAMDEFVEDAVVGSFSEELQIRETLGQSL